MIAEVNGPLIIGGLGGSGTRVVAQIVLEMGYFLGHDLNEENDNLWFTVLFKRPTVFQCNSGKRRRRVFDCLDIFRAGMLSGGQQGFLNHLRWNRAASHCARYGHDHLGSGKGAWAYLRRDNLLSSPRIDLEDYVGWGWKEPNSHIFLDVLPEYFPDMKYIHVMRHGLDMAFSSNQAQLHNWGWMFDLLPSQADVPLPRRSLAYWFRANQRAIECGELMRSDSFLLLRFEDLCANPQGEIERIRSFLGLPSVKTLPSVLAERVQAPPTIGRWKGQPLEMFSEEDFSLVTRMGYSL